jgi:hypothetical protein
MYEDPNRHPWDYYGPMVEAIVGGYGDPRELSARLESALADAERRDGQLKTRGQVRHFNQLAAGAVQLRAGNPVLQVEPAPATLWSHGELDIRVSPHMLLTRKGGRREVWFLYLKERPLEQATADPALMILTDVIASSGLAAIPRVVDVRRAKGFTLTRRRSLEPLRAHVQAEAEQFTRLWQLVA